MQVPFLDLKAHHQPHRAEFLAAIAEVVDANAFAGGPFVAKFEEGFAAYCGVKHAIGVGNGTDALWLSLLALGVGPGDEVITVPLTFMATAEAISFTGATPVFVDVDPKTWLMDAAKLEAAITPRTKAIMPVHLHGQTADMDAINTIACRHELPVVEDAAQAHGATNKGRKAGGMGIAAGFSYYPGKNLGAFGEAGAVTTNNDELARKIRILRDHGQVVKYEHDYIGWNGRMDGIQGAVLSIKLKHIDAANAARHRHATQYNELLGGIEGITIPTETKDNKHIYHVYAIRVENRDALAKALNEKGIATGIHYPIPIHRQKAYGDLGHQEGDFPVSEQCAAQFLSLPMYPELTEDQVTYVCDTLRSALSQESFATV
ncbi:MAG: DegT/DnrJ/EryC1/StrS family aminotransferase [Opitutaceae bacterium]